MTDRPSLEEFDAQRAELMQEFSSQFPSWRAEVTQFMNRLQGEGNEASVLEAMRHRLHQLAGAAASLGFAALGEAAREAERLTRECLAQAVDSPERLLAALQTLQHRLDQQIPADDRRFGVLVLSTSSEQADRAEGRICLVDDDSLQARELAAQLEYFGYTTQVYTDLTEAKEAIRLRPPQLILMDLVFPEGDAAGAEAVSAWRGNMSEPLPVLFVSIRTDLVARLLAVRAGGLGFFAKPVDVAVLLDSLDGLIVRRPPAPYRILVVDDDRIQANLNASHLRRAGMEVQVVTQPLEMLDALFEFQPELLLLDMYMPDCTGMELARVVRQMEAFDSLPIVFLSAETDRDKQLAAVGLGGDDFLVKPIKPDHLVSSVVSRAERYRKLRVLMLRDSLSGLFNHSTIKERLAQEIARARRQQSQLAAIMIDIDQFKQVNDVYGHAAGDRVIKNIAHFLLQRLRETDIIGRYGGEEFLVILPDTAAAHAQDLIGALRFAFSQIRQYAGREEFIVTFSAGVAGYPGFNSADTVIEAADRALYQAKEQGRNRVMLAG
ncbi:MAG: diguanylate cyclase [Methylococcaceae bacterium]|nr:diguanylate cyclase [Methylococcaceae bacterium]